MPTNAHSSIDHLDRPMEQTIFLLLPIVWSSSKEMPPSSGSSLGLKELFRFVMVNNFINQQELAVKWQLPHD